MTRVRLAIALWFLAVCASVLVRADDRWPAWTAEAKLDLSKAILAESNFRDEQEGAAIAWVLTKRWRRLSADTPISQMIRNYCALWEPQSYQYYSERSTSIRAATLQSPPGRGYSRRWKALTAFVERFAGRQITDPCPEAMHWGSEDDRKRVPDWKVVCVFGKSPRRQYFLREK